MIPKIAIIGRPNVGKSTLFNRIVKRKKAIVQDKPGITRDRLYGKAKFDDHEFVIIDTGGYDTHEDEENLLNIVNKQIFSAIDEADALIFLLDGKSGLSSLDLEINESLRFVDKPVFYAINKMDRGVSKDNLYDFYRLGVEDIYPISAEHKSGVADLMADVIKAIPKVAPEEEEEKDDIIKIAIIGRPNVGKSSIINKLLNEERVIVNNAPGTTRDSVDTLLVKDDKKYLLIDTAGIRAKSRVKRGVETYSVQVALKSIRRCDIVVLVVDAVEGVVEQDTKIAGYANEMGKACLVVVNKWDIVDKESFLFKDFLNTIHEKLKYLRYAPVISTSVLTNLRVEKILRIADTIHSEYNKRISTGKANTLLQHIIDKHSPPIVRGKIIKFFYMTQVDTKPPHFVIFTRHSKLVHFSYQRFIINQIRNEHKFIGCPIILEFKERRSIYKK
jgi:GTP-binding protein